MNRMDGGGRMNISAPVVDRDIEIGHLADEGLSQAEIAKRLGISQATVSRAISKHRAAGAPAEQDQQKESGAADEYRADLEAARSELEQCQTEAYDAVLSRRDVEYAMKAGVYTPSDPVIGEFVQAERDALQLLRDARQRLASAQRQLEQVHERRAAQEAAQQEARIQEWLREHYPDVVEGHEAARAALAQARDWDATPMHDHGRRVREEGMPYYTKGALAVAQDRWAKAEERMRAALAEARSVIQHQKA